MTADHVPEERPDDERPDELGSGRPAETSDAEVDRLFAELVAGYGRTAGAGDRVRPGDAGASAANPTAPDLTSPLGPASPADDGPQPISWPTRNAEDWAADHPLLARPGSPTPDVPVPPRARRPGEQPEAPPASTWRTPTTPSPEEEPYERYRPELTPLGRPRWPIVVGWSAMTLAVVATLLAVFGVPLPTWAGWLAVGGFLGGFGLLVAQLPRHRPPGAGDGAGL